MEPLGYVLNSIGGLGMLVCFILVIVAMFQRGSSGMAIVCLVLVCCGIGGLVAYVYGWIKSGEWGLKNVMIVWTVCLILCVVGNALAPSAISMLGQFPQP